MPAFVHGTGYIRPWYLIFSAGLIPCLLLWQQISDTLLKPTALGLPSAVVFASTGGGLGQSPFLSYGEDSGPSMAETVRGLNHRAYALYGRLVRDSEENNFVCSPYGLNLSLALSSMAARGQTETVLSRWLSLPTDRTLRAAAVRAVNNDVQSHAGTDDHFVSANRVWVQIGTETANGFDELSRKFFGTTLGRVDFVANPSAARAMVNAWVNDHTNKLIKGLVGTDDISTSTRVMLTSALSFKGTWDVPFPSALTRNLPFSLDGSVGGTVMVPTMSCAGAFRYCEFDGCRVLELPYQGRHLSMILLLPSEGKVSALEAKLSDEQVSRWVGELQRTTVKVQLPKFSTRSRIRTDEALRALGLEEPFSDQADFSGLTDGGPSLHLDRVVHEARVEIDETGTKAASGAVGSWGMRSKPISFNVDRPFIFVIRDQTNGVVLFLGRIVDPS
jgi:serpin B